jgi:hypothetical protein
VSKYPNRIEEVVKSQMKKKEEDCENLEEKFVMLRVKVFKLNKNIEEESTSSIKIVEEKCDRSSERKTE